MFRLPELGQGLISMVVEQEPAPEAGMVQRQELVGRIEAVQEQALEPVEPSEVVHS